MSAAAALDQLPLNERNGLLPPIHRLYLPLSFNATRNILLGEPGAASKKPRNNLGKGRERKTVLRSHWHVSRATRDEAHFE